MKIGLQSYGTQGDINPFLQLAGGLRKNGHEVTMVITTPHRSDYSAYAEKFDIKIVECKDEKYYKNVERFHQFTPEEMAEYFNNLNKFAYQAAQELCSQVDLVIGNIGSYYLHAYAELANIPYINMCLEHSLVPSKNVPMVSWGYEDMSQQRIEMSWKHTENSVNALRNAHTNTFRQERGLAPIENMFTEFFHSQKLHLIGVSKVFCYEHTDWQGLHYVSGYLFLDHLSSKKILSPELEAFLAQGEAPIFFGLGSLICFEKDPTAMLNKAINAAANVGRKLILQADWENIQVSDLTLNDQVYLLEYNIDHKVIFPHCAVVVHHGGAGTTHTTTISGCPSIVIDYGGDMVLWAEIMSYLGIAPQRINNEEVTIENLTDRLQQVLSNPTMKEKAVVLSKIMQTEDPIKRINAAIEAKFGNSINVN